MKRIAFFIFITLLFIQSQIIHASSKDTYTVLETKIEVVKLPDRKIQIAFLNDNPFDIILGDEHHQYNVNGIDTDLENYIIYGYVADTSYQGPDYYDAYILIVSRTGEILHETHLNLGNLEEVKTMILLEGKPIFHVRSLYEDEYAYYHHDFDYFIVFDEEYQSYESIKFKEEILRIQKDHQIIYVSDKFHGDYHAGFNNNLEVLYDGIVYGVVNYGVYYGEVTITLLNGGIVNQEKITHQKTLDYPGYYQILYKNQIVTFTIHPIISGISANQITNDSVAIDINRGHSYLNNDVYISGTLITQAGHYELIVEGFNGYHQIIPFTIASNLKGIYNEQVYFEEKTITFNGVGYLNNRFIESGYQITESGHYTLTIYGENGYTEAHHFQLDLSQQQQNNIKQSLMYLEITLISLAVSLTFIFIFKKHIYKKIKAS
ncbi:MAG: hypothetical protein ACNA7U_01810 [Candidatus Izemoplasmataceae bacterium]